MKKITHVAWFTDTDCSIGIIIVENDNPEDSKALIGTVDGDNERKDLLYIAGHGAKFPLAAALITMKNQGQKITPPLEYSL